jgi:WD40 repeat protein
MLAVGMIDGTVVVLPITSDNPDKPMATFQGHKGEVTSVKFAPDQTVLASASRDGTVRFWRLK